MFVLLHTVVSSSWFTLTRVSVFGLLMAKVRRSLAESLRRFVQSQAPRTTRDRLRELTEADLLSGANERPLEARL